MRVKQRRKYDPDTETWDMEAMFTGKGGADGSPWVMVDRRRCRMIPWAMGGIDWRNYLVEV